MNKIAYNRILEVYMTNDELIKTNPIIYSNDLFEIHLDDLYIYRSQKSNKINVFLDISKYFDMKYLKTGNKYLYTCTCTCNGMRNKKYVNLGSIIVAESLVDSLHKISNTDIDILAYIHFIYKKELYLRIIPGDYESCLSLSYATFDYQDYQDYNKSQYMHKRNNRKKIIYKKLKPFNTIYALQIIKHPLNLLLQTICYTLTQHIKKKLRPDIVGPAIRMLMAWNDCNKKYKFVKFLYTLISMHIYKEVEMLLNKILNNPNYTAPMHKVNINFNISHKSKKKFGDEFDLLYAYLIKYTYNDVCKIDSYLYNQDQKCKMFDSEFYEKFNIVSAHVMKCWQLSMQNNIIPKIKSCIVNIFNNYEQLYNLVKPSRKQTYTYLIHTKFNDFTHFIRLTPKFL